MNAPYARRAGRDQFPLLFRVEIEAPVAIWQVHEDGVVEPELIATLSVAEHDRAARFRHPWLARRYTAAHAALRQAVFDLSGIAPMDQVYQRDPLGQWHLVSHPQWQVSMSYAGHAAFVAVAPSCAIGIDAEPVEASVDPDELAREHFTRGEIEQYRQLPSNGRRAAALRGWTRKEACLKAIGTGLQRPPATIETGLDGAVRSWIGGSCVEIDSFTLPGFIGAWARCPAPVHGPGVSHRNPGKEER